MSRQRAEIGPVVGFLDLESLGVFDDSVILSLGMVIANLNKPLKFQDLIGPKCSRMLKFQATGQRKLGRVVQPSCVRDFWQDPCKVTDKAREVSLFPNPKLDIDVSDIPRRVAESITELCAEWDVDPNSVHWFDRNGFDFTKMSHIYQITLGLEPDDCPWHPGNTWEISSILHHLGQDRYAGIGPWDFERQGMIYHHPVHDSALDWLRYQKSLYDQGVLEIDGC